MQTTITKCKRQTEISKWQAHKKATVNNVECNQTLVNG